MPKPKKKKKEPKEEEEPIPPELERLELPALKDRKDNFFQRYKKAAKDRNYIQLEKDMVNKFYQITQNEVKQIEAELLNMDRQMEKLERDHRVHIKVHEQKVQNLEYEHKNSRRQVASEGDNSISKERMMHSERITDMNDEKTDLKKRLRSEQVKNEEELQMMRQGFDKSLAKTREIFEENHRKLQQQYEEQVDQLKVDLELRRKVEIHEIEERQNSHINKLMFNHQEAFDNIKAYYNDITHDNLQLIRQLKDDINDMKEREKANQKHMAMLTCQNKELSEPLAQKQQKQRELEEKLKCKEKDKMALKNLKAHHKQLDDRISEAKAEYRNTEEKYRKIERERDDLRKRFSKAVQDIQRKAELGKNAVLEKKLEQLQGQYEEKQAQLTEVLSAAKLDPMVVASVTKKLEQVLGDKNRQIRDLHYQVHQCTKAYNDTIRVYESKLPTLGIDPEEIGFEQIPNATSTMPARLVTRVA